MPNKMSSKTSLIGVCVIVIIIVLFFANSMISRITIDPGTEVVLINQPYFFGRGGIEDEPLTEGAAWVWSSTKPISVSMVPTSENIAFDDFSSKDNILLDFETTFQYRVNDSVALIKHFGQNWFENNIMSQYPAIVRDVVKTVTMTDLMSSPTSAANVDLEVTKRIKALIQADNLPIEVINISLGRAKPNETVQLQINETAAQQQRQKTIDAGTIAEKKRAAEEEARAIADMAYRNKTNMSMNDFIELEKAKIYADACIKANSCIITSNQSMGVNLNK